MTAEIDPAPGTGEVTATVIVNAPAQRVFAAFTAWERQGEWIPFTKVRVADGDGGEGSTIEAVTAVGPAVLRDVMRVEKVDPPYEVRVVHTRQGAARPGRHAVHADGRRPHPGGLARVVPAAGRRSPAGSPGRCCGPARRSASTQRAAALRPAGRGRHAAVGACRRTGPSGGVVGPGG